MTHRPSSLVAAAILALPAVAAAEWRCDCTTITASCSADVSVADTFIEVTADTNRCARVDYFLDGRPFVAVVTDGSERQDWISRSADPNVLVQSCQVCRDNAGTDDSGADTDAAASGEAGGAAGADTLEPLIEVVPSYPEAAAERGASGYVEVAFTVRPSGEVDDVSVIESEPGELFDAAAVAAVRRWRYPADTERSAVELTERLEFEPGMAGGAAPAAAPADGTPVPEAEAEGEDTADGPANQCVRENAVYNYGELVEVGLINACGDPLAVYACAEGVGPRQDRWHCTAAGEQRRLLVARGDDRVGESVISPTPEGQGSYEYVDELYLTRAPNSQYWWLACRVADSSCRTAGRDWVRAVDGQLARIDPGQRARAPVSRSY